jgi:hypothetical protein
MNTETQKWSLRKEVAKRKTQQAQQVSHLAAAKRTTTIHQSIQSSQTRPQPLRRKATGETPALGRRKVLLARLARLMDEPMRWTRVQRRIAALAAMALVPLCMFTVLIAKSQPVAQMGLPSLPVAQVDGVVSYLKANGISVANLRTFDTSTVMQNAREEIQFEVYEGRGKGLFLLLSYDSADQAGLDAFKVSNVQRFKSWKLTQIANVLLLASPESHARLGEQIASHLTQYLVAPYRSYIPTATAIPGA